ncbi:hypothetical protein AX15_000139 [Amanita polypyramis BW_CC]|nr:hypothetical protein AX15_000139 [Amanita polypyramis BW_CC]
MPAQLPSLDHLSLDHLHLALAANPKSVPDDDISFLHDPVSPAIIARPADSDLDYTSRRMSSSATSTADSDSVLSRGEKRTLSPSDSPQPKKLRHDAGEHTSWDMDPSTTQQAGSVDCDKSATIDQSKLQLPSILTSFEDPSRNESRRSSLSDLTRHRHSPYPQPSTLRHTYGSSSLASYTFPPQVDQTGGDRLGRPKISTAFGLGIDNAYTDTLNPGLSNGTTPSSSTYTTSNYNSPLSSDYHRPPGLAYYENDTWNSSPPSAIVRPNSTPGQLGSPAVKYEDGLRHTSFNSLPQSHMFAAGSGRISGQQDRRSVTGIKSEWNFSSNSSEYTLPGGNSHYSPPMAPTPPSISVSNSPPRVPSSVTASSLVDRPPRKRGKLPKETTDFLKAWLHRHSDHPYPSEEEKKQLCNATGLSMSQVSNWMINARRRILAPAHRAATGPTTTAPFPPSGRPLSNFLDPMGRRASMPADTTLQLFHPMTLQTMSNSPSYSSNYVNGRTAPPLSRQHMSPATNIDYDHGRQMAPLYGPGTRSTAPTSSPHYISSDLSPLSAPPSMSNNPFTTHGSHQTAASTNVYSSYDSRLPQTGTTQPTYYDGQPGSGPGSGYPTPQ